METNMTIITVSLLTISSALIYAYLPDKKGEKFKRFIRMVFSFFPVPAITKLLKAWKED